MLRAATFAALCLGLGLAVAQQPAPAPAGAAGVTMDDIKKAWQDRQDKVKTLKMSWKQTVVEPKGSLDFIVKLGKIPGAQAPQPPRDLSLAGEATLVLDEKRFRFESRRDVWWMQTQSIKQSRRLSAFDGNNYHTLESSDLESGREQATVQPSRSSREAEFLELKPVWWCVRGADNLHGSHSLQDYEVTGRTLKIRDVPCLELESKSRARSGVDRLEVSERSFLPIRYTRVRNGQTTTQVDIEYEKVGTTPLVPTKWRYAMRNSTGRMTESLEASVTHREIGSPIEEASFQLGPRPGTVVVDTREKQLRVGVVLPDGTTSETVERRSVRTYDELVEVTRTNQSRWWWVVGAGVCVFLACVLFFIARFQKRKAGRLS